MKKVLTAAGAMLALTAPSFAADLPVRGPAIAPAPIFVAINWTGFYVGANVGYGFGESRWRSTVPGSAFATPKPDGFMGGVQAGYNLQLSSIVLGVEGDIGTGVADTVLWSNPVFRARTNTDYLASLRLRAGFAVDNFLVYATGGAGFADWKHRTFVFGTGASGNNTGWVAGLGVEYAINNNWSAKLEYLHYDFGGKLQPVGTLDVVPQRTTTRVDTIKIGLNYRFGGPSAAVVAKY